MVTFKVFKLLLPIKSFNAIKAFRANFLGYTLSEIA